MFNSGATWLTYSRSRIAKWRDFNRVSSCKREMCEELWALDTKSWDSTSTVGVWLPPKSVCSLCLVLGWWALQMDDGNNYTTMWMYLRPLNHIPKNGKLHIIFYHNKKSAKWHWLFQKTREQGNCHVAGPPALWSWPPFSTLSWSWLGEFSLGEVPSGLSWVQWQVLVLWQGFLTPTLLASWGFS